MNGLLAQLATLGPLGRSLPAPGTAGSLFALVTGFFLSKGGILVLLPALLLVLAPGAWRAA